MWDGMEGVVVLALMLFVSSAELQEALKRSQE